jgi:hypothetical protein
VIVPFGSHQARALNCLEQRFTAPISMLTHLSGDWEFINWQQVAVQNSAAFHRLLRTLNWLIRSEFCLDIQQSLFNTHFITQHRSTRLKIALLNFIGDLSIHDDVAPQLFSSQICLAQAILTRAVTPSSFKPFRESDLKDGIAALLFKWKDVAHSGADKDQISFNRPHMTLRLGDVHPKYEMHDGKFEISSTSDKATRIEPKQLTFARATPGIKLSIDGLLAQRLPEGTRCYAIGNLKFSKGIHRWTVVILEEKPCMQTCI